MKEISVGELTQPRFVKLLPQLDEAFGGQGMMWGQICTIQSRSGVGKTTLAAYMAKCVQEQFGVECLFVPAEGRSLNDPRFYKRCGIDNPILNKIVRPETGEDFLGVNFLKAIEKKLQSNKPQFIVLDSVQSLITDKEHTEGVGVTDIGKQAGLIGRFAKLMQPMVEMTSSILVILKQERANLAMGKAPSPQGGLQLEHASSLELKLYYGDDIEVGGDTLGFKVKVAIEKCPGYKPSPYKKQGGIEIAQFWKNGFDFEYNLVEHACVLGLIEAGGAGWHTIPKVESLDWPPEDFKMQSRYNVAQELKNHPEYTKWLYKECEGYYSSNETKKPEILDKPKKKKAKE